VSENPLRVLVVEDDAEMAALLRARLEGARGRFFEIAVAASLEQALRQLAAATPDVVLLDLNLPDSAGEETFRRVRERAADAPVVVLTSVEDDALSDRLVGAGAQDYLVKGEIAGSIVARTLRHAVERRRAALERERLLAEVKTLSGLLPICSGCKRIRDDRGSWTSVETYIQARSQAQFSHGICPECMRRLYPGYCDRHGLA
jgi:PleD family two-component response regulator